MKMPYNVVSIKSVEILEQIYIEVTLQYSEGGLNSLKLPIIKIPIEHLAGIERLVETNRILKTRLTSSECNVIKKLSEKCTGYSNHTEFSDGDFFIVFLVI